MRISTPLTRRARKHKVVIQWVTRTTAECREVSLAAGTTEAEAVAQTESAIPESVSTGATSCTQLSQFERTGGQIAGSDGVASVLQLHLSAFRNRMQKMVEMASRPHLVIASHGKRSDRSCHPRAEFAAAGGLREVKLRGYPGNAAGASCSDTREAYLTARAFRPRAIPACGQGHAFSRRERRLAA